MTSNWNKAEFLEISSTCGFDISLEDIEALSKRKLLTAWTGDVFGSAHLFLLAMYFDAITVHRHPWSVRNSEATLQDVKQLNNEISQLDPTKEDDGTRVKVAQSCRTFLSKVDPFGPLNDVVEMLNAPTIKQFKNTGRLACEINLLITYLEESARPTSVTTILESVKPERGPKAVTNLDLNSRDTEEGEAIIPTATVAAPTKPPEPEVPEKNEEVAPPLVVGGPDGIDGDKTLPVSGAFHEGADESAEMVLTDLVEESVPDDAAFDSPDSEPSVGLEESSANFDLKPNETQSPFVPSRKTLTLIDRLNAVKTIEPADIAAQIQALNTQRQTLISNQDWQGLADLYEDKIDLFTSPEERQEVLLTLATLHELKIKNPRRAITFFQLAVKNGSTSGLQKAYEGIQRVGVRPDLKSFCLSWLDERLNEEIGAAELPLLQLSNSNFLKECGKPHHAFLTYAAFLTRDPTKNVTEASLRNLETFAIEIEDSEIESFYSDILDFEDENQDYSSTRTLIAKRAGLFYKDRNPMLAVKYLRISLENNPSEEASYLAISHIYQEEENWPDLIQLASKRHHQLNGQERVRAGVQLEQFIAEDVNDGDSVDRYHEWAKLDPDSWAIEGMIAAIGKSGRLAEGYALLQNLVGNVNDVEKKEKIYLSLAKTALSQFESPEDAISHYKSGLELTKTMSRQKADLLAGFADLHIEAGKWEIAIDALDKLTVDHTLPTEERMAWLNKGAQIAELACIDSKLQLFKTRIAEVASP